MNQGPGFVKKGATPIRVEFYEFSGQEGILLGWSGPDTSGAQQWLSEAKPNRKNQTPLPVIDLSPTGKESVIYNNFLNGTRGGRRNGSVYIVTSSCSSSATK